jgi:hypothetical protein
MKRKSIVYSIFALITLVNTALCFAAPLAFVGRMPYSAEMAYKATQIQLEFDLVANSPKVPIPIQSCELPGLPHWAIAPKAPTFQATCTYASGPSKSYSGYCNGKPIPLDKQPVFQNKTGSVCTMFVTVSGNPVSSGKIDTKTYSPKFIMKLGSRRQSFISDEFKFSAASGKSTGKSRSIIFQSYCPADIYPAMAAGATQPAYMSSGKNTLATCTVSSNAGCYPGSTCVATGNKNQCFWKVPIPSNGFKLAAYSGTGTPHSTRFSVPVYDNGIQQQWSGNMAGRANCTTPGYQCAVSDCGSNAHNGSCPLGSGFSTKGPITGNEITFQGGEGTLPTLLPKFAGLAIYKACGPSGAGSCVVQTQALPVDFYDVSIINGVTIPYSITPVTNISPPYNPITPSAPPGPDPYSCSVAGNIQETTKLAASSWSFSPNPSEDYIWVQYNPTPGAGCTVGGGGANGCACSTGHTTCTSANSKCGIAYNPGGNTGTYLKQICGPDVIAGAPGKPMTTYWTADEICAVDSTSSIGVLFQCTTTGKDLNACTGSFAQSCYTKGASNSCCGCPGPSTPDLWSSILGVPVPSSSICANTNTTWQTAALGINGTPVPPQPYVLWLKQACPTCYTYPYDDPNSTFTCGNGVTNSPAYNNTVNYLVTFCPQHAP